MDSLKALSQTFAAFEQVDTVFPDFARTAKQKQALNHLSEALGKLQTAVMQDLNPSTQPSMFGETNELHQ